MCNMLALDCANGSLASRARGRSKQQLQSELNLPRRAEIARREACAGDDSKRAAGCGQHWIPKIGVIENIEKLAAELQVEPFGYLRVLGYRKVCVHKAGAGDGIAS